MYKLTDTFNDQLISRHRSLAAAVRAQIRHARAVRRNNGASSYIPTVVTLDGNALSDEMADERARLNHAATYER
jgi:hypothetical protein